MEQYLPLLIAGAMIIFMISSSRKRKAQAAQMATKVVPGAKIMLTSGIYGEVVSIKDDRAVIKSAGNTSLEVSKLAIARVIENSTDAKSNAVKAVSAEGAAKKPAAKKPAAKK